MKELIGRMSQYSKVPMEIIAMLIVFIAGMIIMKIILTVERRMMRKSVLDPAAYVVVVRTTKIVLWIMTGLTMLSVAGINTTPLLTVLASVGVALALALKDSLSNVAGGIIILFTKPFGRGDEIQVEDISGVVDYIDLMSTKMHTFSNQDITIPNSKLVNSIIVNKTRYDLVRVDCKFGVSYDSDLEKVKVLLNNIVKDGELLLEKPKPVIGISSYEQSAVIWDMYVWTRKDDRFKAKYYLGQEVKKVFDANGIRIPFPHIDVTVEGGDDNK